MKTIRRIYIYAVAFVSLEVVVWAVISLGRTLFADELIGGDVGQLAGALAFVLVGLPVFILHWWLAQRDSAKSSQEHFSAVRALFLYAASLSLGIPVIQNLLAIVQRLLALLFSVDVNDVMIGGGQTWADNLVAIVVNALFFWYIHSIINKDWGDGPEGAAYVNLRRAWRYIWALYGLVYTFFGVHEIIFYTLGLNNALVITGNNLAINGISFSLFGGVTWYLWWNHIQKSLVEPAEKESMLRLIILYAVSFTTATRVKVFNRLAEAGFSCPSAVHPTAYIEPSATLAPGVQVFPQAYVGSDVQVGFGTIVNTGAIISHDCVLGDYSNIAPGAILAGAVEVGDYSLIGMGVTLNLNVKVGPRCQIGNGATVKSDVPEGGIVRAGSIWPK